MYCLNTLGTFPDLIVFCPFMINKNISAAEIPRNANLLSGFLGCFRVFLEALRCSQEPLGALCYVWALLDALRRSCMCALKCFRGLWMESYRSMTTSGQWILNCYCFSCSPKSLPTTSTTDSCLYLSWQRLLCFKVKLFVHYLNTITWDDLFVFFPTFSHSSKSGKIKKLFW